jgi:hypothetical protein
MRCFALSVGGRALGYCMLVPLLCAKRAEKSASLPGLQALQPDGHLASSSTHRYRIAIDRLPARVRVDRLPLVPVASLVVTCTRYRY